MAEYRRREAEATAGTAYVDLAGTLARWTIRFQGNLVSRARSRCINVKEENEREGEKAGGERERGRAGCRCVVTRGSIDLSGG